MRRINGPKGPPVRLLSDLQAVDQPQYLPPTPHRLPPSSERPVMRKSTLLADDYVVPQAPPGVTPSTPTPAPYELPNSFRVFDAHRYANAIEGTYLAPAASDGVPFLFSPSTRRNFLGFRNTQAAGGDEIFISFGREASANSWLVLTPTEIVVFTDVVLQNDIYAISTTGVGRLAFIFATYQPA